jgi:hypothetical protein
MASSGSAANDRGAETALALAAQCAGTVCECHGNLGLTLANCALEAVDR